MYASARSPPPRSGRHSQSRPGTTDSTWHVGKIKNNQGIGITFAAFEAYTVPASTSRLVGIVNANIDLSVVGVDEAAGLGGGLVYVVDVASGRVVSLFK
jgi:hypothetical protein